MSFGFGGASGSAVMEIQQIKHLMAAAECGNLLKAADECH